MVDSRSGATSSLVASPKPKLVGPRKPPSKKEEGKKSIETHLENATENDEETGTGTVVGTGTGNGTVVGTGTWNDGLHVGILQTGKVILTACLYLEE